jgi:membrane-associated phospholipid phosphatase
VNDVLARVVRLDGDLFARVAGGHTPWLDRGVPLLSRSANHGLLWMAIAGGMAAIGGPSGRRAAVRGLTSTGVTSLVVNQVVKRLVRRPRPSLRDVPAARRLRLVPLTTSFPSGHAASAAAFATGAAIELPPAGPPLAALAAAVGGSRVYVGVHYPLDVLVGAGVGAIIAGVAGRLWPVVGSRTAARSPVSPPSTGRAPSS